MQCYVEVTLLPSAEIPLYFLWAKVYQQVHLALVDEAKTKDGFVSIGVSFPEYNADQNHLGSKLRLFAAKESELQAIKIDQWLRRLVDYVHITRIRPVPDTLKKFALFKRVQTKSSTARLARRKAKREGISFEVAMEVLADHKEKISKLPFIHIKSLSSEKQYRLMISCTETDEKSYNSKFNTYGLSNNCSVPLF